MIETKNEIEYQFTAIPTNLFLCLDNNCRSMLFTLIQLSTYYADKESGYFFRTNADLQAETNLSENVIRATLSSLFDSGLVEVRTVGKSKGTIPNNFRVNFKRFLEWDKYSIEDCMKNPEFKIETAEYRVKGFVPSYLKNKDKASKQDNIDVIDEFVEEHPKTLMKQSAMEIAKAIAQEHSQSEHNINNVDNEKNNSMSVNNRSDVSNGKNLSEQFKEYKKQEDFLMNKLIKAKCWTDFTLYRRDVKLLIKNNPNDKWNANTMKRYNGVEKAKLQSFAKKYANAPYNPAAEEVYERTNCGWNNNHSEVIQEDDIPQETTQPVEGKMQYRSLDDEWAAHCEKIFGGADEKDASMILQEDLPF